MIKTIEKLHFDEEGDGLDRIRGEKMAGNE